MKYFLQRTMSAFICFISICCLLGFTECRRHCFSCTTKESGLTCLHNPENVTEGQATIPCKYYCTIRREDYIYILDEASITYFNRSCERNPVNNSIVMDDYFITYYRACRSHLCNYGDGVESLRHMPDEGEEEDEPLDVHSASINIKPSNVFSRFPNLFFWINSCLASLVFLILFS